MATTLMTAIAISSINTNSITASFRKARTKPLHNLLEILPYLANGLIKKLLAVKCVNQEYYRFRFLEKKKT